MIKPYYSDDLVTLFHGDCREITDWLAADVLVVDPPYGREWRQGQLARSKRAGDNSHSGIRGDADTEVRDAVLAAWGSAKVAVVFGDLMLPPPAGNRQTLVYRKPPDAGNRGATNGRRRDLEAIYLVGPWPSGLGGASSVLATAARTVGNPSGLAARYGHPHAKPLDVMEELIHSCPPGVIADPCAGSGSTLVAAKLQGRAAIGVELDESYCARIAERLDQDALPFGEAS